MELGTGIVLLPFHHPVDIAERVATLDALHDGRTVFSVGTGYRDVEFDAFGVPKAERVSRLKQGVELSTRLLSEDDVTYAVDDVTIPVQLDDIEVWMAANANRAVERAAHLTDAGMVNPHSIISEIRAQKEQYYDPVR